MELGFSYLDLQKLPCEPHSCFLERSYFVINNKYEEEEGKLIELSKYIYAIKYLGCKYDDKIMENIIKMAKNSGISLD